MVRASSVPILIYIEKNLYLEKNQNMLQQIEK